ncbi:FMN-dependent NADH-azoreductase [Sphingopyxis panaciterrae]|uniref:FMN-dependent NADH-azoreductase n=1 Tax=Sphingopyxis panaciterrae TaxID=363841 RepID=UPI00141E94F3|nr:NAD(P)H-dependent oxidoreductase [Sphingopyxis panaciterrae]NIJ35854.1 FMN-dependent NADH-azoreductase [Sphingopyxis panaciterrae]
MNVLHISGSPKGERSDSRKLAARFLERYRVRHPSHDIRHVDVFDGRANPGFGAVHAFHKLAPLFGEPQTAEGKRAWVATERLIGDFDRADKILLSCPMWNYSVPWAMKRYLDNLMQPGRTFGFDAETRQHIGLLRDRPVQLILTRSSTDEDDRTDFQLPYLRHVFEAMGLADIRVLSACATTWRSAEDRQAYIDSFTPQLEHAADAL